jgi:hypothetical protein
VVIEAEDSGSGILKYEMRIGAGAWKEVVSPAPVQTGFFAKTAYVRAYDHSGNYREQSVAIPSATPIAIYVLLVAMLAVFSLYKLLKYKQ